MNGHGLRDARIATALARYADDVRGAMELMGIAAKVGDQHQLGRWGQFAAERDKLLRALVCAVRTESGVC